MIQQKSLLLFLVFYKSSLVMLCLAFYQYLVNAVVVGWGGEGGAQNINYTESASTTRTVGAEAAEVVINLIRSGGGNRSLMHCTGSSLGAHVCGHMGRWAADQGHKPGRITG